MKVSAKATLEANDNGTFTLLASTAHKDREGDTLSLNEWQTPLPERVPINIDHSMNIEGIVGSGKPVLTARGLEIHGEWADTDRAQNVRKLVAGGHAPGVSVEFLSHRQPDGTVKRELLGAGIVYVPANPNAKVLAAKSFMGAQDSLIQGIHDAAVHLGASCACAVPTEAAPDPDDGSDDGGNKSFSPAMVKALRLRLAALDDVA